MSSSHDQNKVEMEIQELDNILGNLKKSMNNLEGPSADISEGYTFDYIQAYQSPPVLPNLSSLKSPPKEPPPLPPPKHQSDPTLMETPSPPPPLQPRKASIDEFMSQPALKDPIKQNKSLDSLALQMLPDPKMDPLQDIMQQLSMEQTISPNEKLPLPLNISPPPPLPPPRRPTATIHTAQSLPILPRISSTSFEGPEEIDFGEDSEQDKMEEERKRVDLNRMSQYINFEQVTVDDLKELDNLLTDLDTIFKRPKQPAPPPPLSPPPLPPAIQNLRKESSLENVLKKKELKKDASPDSMPLALLANQQQQQKAKETPPTSDSEDNKPILSDSEKEEQIKLTMQKLQEADVKKVQTRIYIENAKQFKTILVTSLMNSLTVGKIVKEKALLEDNPDWTLFELVNDLGIERPLRDFEMVAEVVASWGRETSNALLIKKYGYRDSLTVAGAKETYPRMCGWVYLEVKKGKWQKKYCELKANGLYYAKDSRNTSEQILCSLEYYDVYTLIRSKSKAPTKFCFAMKGQNLIQHYENTEDYCYFFCVDHLEKMKDWVLSIRNAKSQYFMSARPELFPKLERKHSRKKSAGLKKSVSANQLSYSAAIKLGNIMHQPRPRINDNTEVGVKMAPAPRNQQPKKLKPVVPQTSEKESLFEIISKQQGLPVDGTTTVNKTQFGENGKPLVPLTVADLTNIPGVDIKKYAPAQKKAEKKAYKKCDRCGCTDFARNPFKETSCANCFHTH